MSTNYEHLSRSSPSRKDSGTVSGLFSEIDADGDGVIDRKELANYVACLLYTSPSPRDRG